MAPEPGGHRRCRRRHSCGRYAGTDFFSGWWFRTFFMFPYIGNNMESSSNSLIFFRGVGQPPTSFILGGFENTGGILDDWILNPCFLGWTHLELFHILPENGPRKNRSLSPRMFGNPTIEPNHRVLKVSRNPTIEKSNVIGLPCFRSQSFRLAGMGEQHLI